MKTIATPRHTALATVLGISLAITAPAAITTLTFEGLGSLEGIGEFYNGGTGSNGSGPGPALGIRFSQNALAIIDSDAGGSGNFGGEPSPSTVLFYTTGEAATLSYPAGFTTGVSFYYSAVNQPGSISIYDDVDGTGNVLATLILPVTPSDGGDPGGVFSPFYPIGIAFTGTAKSIDFGGTENQIGFDNITLGTDIPWKAPEGDASLILFGIGLAGLAGLGGASRRR